MMFQDEHVGPSEGVLYPIGGFECCEVANNKTPTLVYKRRSIGK